MNWNPITKPYCKDCPFYVAEGDYIYQLERDENLRKCRHLRICHRISKMSNDNRQMQLSDFIATS